MLEKFKLLSIVALVFLLIAISFDKRDKENLARLTEIQSQLAKLANLHEQVQKHKAYLTELEASDSIDKEEIMLMWHSIGTMRGNFVALGLGVHLEEKDICPEEETDCYENGYEEESGIKDEG